MEKCFHDTSSQQYDCAIKSKTSIYLVYPWSERKIRKDYYCLISSIDQPTFLRGFLDRRVFNERKNGFRRDDLDRRYVSLYQIDSRLVDLGNRRFRAGESARSGQAVGTIAPRPDLLDVSALRYAQPFRRTDSTVNTGRRGPWTLTIGAVLRCRDHRADVSSPSWQRARTNILAVAPIRRGYRLCLLSTNWNTRFDSLLSVIERCRKIENGGCYLLPFANNFDELEVRFIINWTGSLN